MQYRKMGKLDIDVSALGFGAMRFPTLGSDEKIDEEKAAEMLDYAIENGVNYLDTAWPYHGGASEPFLGRYLQGGKRQKVYLASKLPTWELEKEEDCDRFLDAQLEKLQTDKIDFYLIHAIQSMRWPLVKKLKVMEWGERAKQDGRIGYFGFSYHDTFELFKEVVDAHDWDFCQIQYNYMNEHVQAGTAGLQYAAEKGLGVVIMEPIYGGTLAEFPEKINRIWEKTERSPVDAALQWLWDKPEVSVVLSGMSTLGQVKENVQSAENSGAGTLSEKDRAVIDKVRDEYDKLAAIPCTKCGYCMPCPNGVDIPYNFELYNNAIKFEGNASDQSSALYNNDLPEEMRANNCISCGICEEKCPQHIKISNWMPKVDQLLSK
ncbi:MAG: aldo/keto reductase [Spirochaetia bacterium]